MAGHLVGRLLGHIVPDAVERVELRLLDARRHEVGEQAVADAARDIVARVAGAEVEPAAAQAAVKEVMAHG